MIIISEIEEKFFTQPQVLSEFKTGPLMNTEIVYHTNRLMKGDYSCILHILLISSVNYKYDRSDRPYQAFISSVLFLSSLAAG